MIENSITKLKIFWSLQATYRYVCVVAKRLVGFLFGYIFAFFGQKRALMRSILSAINCLSISTFTASNAALYVA